MGGEYSIDLSKLIGTDGKLDPGKFDTGIQAEHKEKIISIFNEIADDGQLNTSVEENKWNVFLSKFDGAIDKEDEFKALMGYKVSNVENEFNKANSENKLKNLSTAYEVTNTLIGVEKRERHLIALAKDLVKTTEIKGFDDVKVANDEKALEEYIKGDELVEKSFTGLTASHLDGGQKADLKKEILELKNKNVLESISEIVDLGELVEISKSEDVTDRIKKLEELLSKIDTQIQDLNSKNNDHKANIEKNIYVIGDNIDTKKLADTFYKKTNDPGVQGSAADLETYSIKALQEENIDAYVAIVENDLVLKQLEQLRKVVKDEKDKLIKIQDELGEISEFEEVANKKAFDLATEESKRLTDATRDYKAAADEYQEAIDEQRNATTEYKEEDGSKRLEKKYNKAVDNAKVKDREANIAKNKKDNMDDIVKKYEKSSAELKRLRGENSEPD